MPNWTISSTDTFSNNIKKHKKNRQLLNELDKKIKKLQEDPNSIGKYLAGKLHGLKSTRLTAKYRLIFQVDEKEKKVYLRALDHRKSIYEKL